MYKGKLEKWVCSVWRSGKIIYYNFQLPNRYV